MRSPISRTVSRMNRISSAATSSRVGSPSSSPRISRSTHGLPCAPRPTITAAAPVVASTDWARAREVTSPQAITGTSTSSTSSAVSAVVGGAGVHLPGRAGMESERGGPGLDELRADLEARAGAVLEAPAHLHRDRDVDRARRPRATIRQRALGIVEQRRAGAGLRHLPTGQPKLMSTMSAPASTTIRAASAISGGSEPKIWTASGCSSAAIRR